MCCTKVDIIILFFYIKGVSRCNQSEPIENLIVIKLYYHCFYVVYDT